MAPHQPLNECRSRAADACSLIHPSVNSNDIGTSDEVGARAMGNATGLLLAAPHRAYRRQWQWMDGQRIDGSGWIRNTAGDDRE